jgi:Putative transposase
VGTIANERSAEWAILASREARSCNPGGATNEPRSRLHARTNDRYQARVCHWATQGFLIEEQRLTYLAEADRDSALLPLQAASCTYRIAHGPRAGQKVLSLQNVPDKPSTSDLCANAHGFSLHAAVCWGADQRKELEHLCRYITRPAIANERLKRNRAGDVVLQLKSAYKDGTTHLVMARLQFMQRLAALVPRPRLHLIRFHSVLAPNAKLRSAITPSPLEPATEGLNR